MYALYNLSGEGKGVESQVHVDGECIVSLRFSVLPSPYPLLYLIYTHALIHVSTGVHVHVHTCTGIYMYIIYVCTVKPLTLASIIVSIF